MSFAVEPASIEGFGKLVGRAGDHMREAVAFVKANTEIDQSLAGMVIWESVVNNHDKVLNDTTSMLSRFAQIMESSGEELTRSAGYYRETDEKEAATFDSTCPRPSAARGYEPVVLGDELPSDFPDSVDPLQHLKSEGEGTYLEGWGEEFMLNPVSKIAGTTMDFFSPTGLVSEGLIILGIADLFEKPVTFLGGDWEGYMKAAATWQSVAELCTSVSFNISQGNSALDETWSGNSAETAWHYFHALAEKLDLAAESFTSLSEHYGRVGHAVYTAAETAKGCCVAGSDAVLQFMITQAAAAAAASTLYGGAIAALLEAAAVQRALTAVQRYRDLLLILDVAGAGINSLLTGLLTAYAVSENDVKNFPLPGKSYDSRAV